MDKHEAVKHLIEQRKDAALEDGVVMPRSRATGTALDREYKAMKKDLKAAGYNVVESTIRNSAWADRIHERFMRVV